MKLRKSDRDLTEPTGFVLASEKRREKAEQIRLMKIESERDEEEKRRQFKAQAKPDYEKLQINVMPSARPITVPQKPNFASDKLLKKDRPSTEPKLEGTNDFKF